MIKLVVFVLCFQQSLLSSAQIPNNVKNALLDGGFSGEIYLKDEEGFELYRKVKNGACNKIIPLSVIRPRNTRDVSIAVKAAGKLSVAISVRSGGHSYTCGSLKPDSLHFDLRLLNEKELIEETGDLIRLGPGNTWAQVMEKFPQSEYLYV